MAVQKFKSKVVFQSGIKISTEPSQRALVLDENGNLVASSVTSAELANLSGIDSNIQEQVDAAAQAAADAQSDIDGHIDASADAHDASAISVTPSGNLASTDVQAALGELQGDVDSKISSSEKGAADGVATLDGAGKVPSSQLDIDATQVSYTPAEWAADGFSAAPETVQDALDVLAVKDAFQIDFTPSDSTKWWEGSIPKVGFALDQLGSRVSSVEANKVDASAVGQPNGVASLDSSGLIPSSQLPALAITDVFVVADIEARDALSVQEGDVAKVLSENKTYIFDGSVWVEISATSDVSSVFGRTGNVSAQSGDYSASQITNTPAGSIAATDVQAALNELDGDIGALDGRLDTAEGDISQLQTDVGAAQADADAAQAAADAAQADADAAQLAIDNHLIDSSDAHDASAISLSAVSGLVATDVQAGIAELRGLISAVGSAGDIDEQTFTITSPQATEANVTGFAFSASVVRGFKALVSIEIDATLGLFETIELIGVNKGGSFEMSQSGVGDESGVVLSITSAGQIQYTSASYAGFVSGRIKFRAQTTSV